MEAAAFAFWYHIFTCVSAHRKMRNGSIKIYVMARNVLLAAIGGAAAGAAVANYLNSEKGRTMLNSANGSLNNLKERATGYVKNLQNKRQHTESVQPS